MIRRINANQKKKAKPTHIFDSFLKTNILFRGIDNDKDRNELKKVLNTEEYATGETIFKYGK